MLPERSRLSIRSRPCVGTARGGPIQRGCAAATTSSAQASSFAASTSWLRLRSIGAGRRRERSEEGDAERASPLARPREADTREPGKGQGREGPRKRELDHATSRIHESAKAIHSRGSAPLAGFPR